MAGARKKPNKKGGNYQAYYRDYTGRRVWFVGTSNRKETIQLAQHLESEHRQMALGVKPPPTAPARHRKRPFLEAVNEYVLWGRTFGRADGKGWSGDHERRTERYLRGWAETLSIEVLADLDGILPRVEAVLQQLAEKRLSGRTVLAHAAPLTALCRWCVGHGYLMQNPLDKLPAIDATSERERRAMTPDEIARLFSVAPTWRRLVYAVAICTGLRVSELRRLGRDDLNVENSRLRLRWKQTKNHKDCFCYLPTKLAAVLAEFADSGSPQRLYEKARIRRTLPPAPLLFVPTHLIRCFNADLAKARIGKTTAEGTLDVHALRVAFVTLGVEAGANPKELQSLARHSDPRLTFGIYAKQRDPRMASLAERIGEAIPDVESATGVHFAPEGVTPDARKSLPEHTLPFAENNRGLCHSDTGQPVPESEQNQDTKPTKPLQNGSVTCFQAGDVGHEPNTWGHSTDSSLHSKSATGVLRPSADPDLARLIEAWPQLTQDTRAEILRLASEGRRS